MGGGQESRTIPADGRVSSAGTSQPIVDQRYDTTGLMIYAWTDEHSTLRKSSHFESIEIRFGTERGAVLPPIASDMRPDHTDAATVRERHASSS